MTRKEAIELVAKTIEGDGHWSAWRLVDALSELGLLKLETTEDKDRIAAINCLSLHGYASSADTIVGALTIGGFKITKEPT